MPFGVLGDLDVPLALGLLRLSTEGRPDEDDAIGVIHHAFDAGIRVLDTADSYGLDHKDMHYGEHLAKKAVATWSGARDEVHVVTKVGLARPKGKWRPAGRKEHIRKQVEGSLKAFDTEQLFMLMLHVNDYQCPFEESLAELAKLQDEGKVKHLGLCNVGIAEVRQAQRHFDVEALQVELSVMSRKAATSGLVHLADDLGIPFMAHRPLGGHAKVEKLLKNRAMKPLAKKYDVTPHTCALATLLDLDKPVLPVFGATKIESVDATLSALELGLDDDDRALREKISFTPTEQALDDIRPPQVPAGLPTLAADAGPGDDAEVVIVMGIQGAGKSSRVDPYVDAGYERLNRDLIGGKLSDLEPMLDALLDEGKQRVVLDNTYATAVSRYGLIRIAHKHNVPVRCIHLATPIGEAQVNVAHRVITRYGHLPGPDEIKELQKDDPNLPPPAAMAVYAATFEAPSEAEGFSVVETVDFERQPLPDHDGKGLLLDVDGTLRVTKSGELFPTSPDDIELLPNRKEVLQRWLDDGYQLFFVSNQGGIHGKKLTVDDAKACFERTVELLDLPVAAVQFCPHKAFPVSCFCRKPMPGMAMQLVHEFKLDMKQLHMVGDMDSDRRFAEGLGATYHDAKAFFGDA